MSEFSCEIDLTVRFRDLDTMGHVNNAVYATYLEHARTNYIETVLDRPPQDVGIVLANLEIDFRRPVVYGEPVSVAVRSTAVGESSVPMAYEVRTGDEVAATASSVVVAVDESGSARPIPDAIRERIEAFEGL